MLRNNIIAIITILLIPAYLVRLNIGVPTTLFELYVWVALTALLLGKSRKLFVHDRLLIIGILLMLAGGAVSAALSDNLRVSAGLWKGFLLTPILAGIILYFTKPSSKVVVNSLLTVGFVVAVSAVWQWLTGDTVDDGRVVGIFGLEPGASPNYLSLFLTPIAVLGLARLLKSGEPSAKIRASLVFNFIAIVAIILAIIASGSRAGIGSVIICLFILFWQKIRKKFRYKFIDAIFTLMLVGAVIFAWQNGLPDFSDQTRERVGSSNNIRFEIWKTTAQEIIPQYPVFGLGMGRFQHYFGELTKDRVNFKEFVTPLAVTPHNILLSTWVNLGIIGLVGLMLVIWRFFVIVPFNSIWAITLFSILLLGIFDTSIYKNDLGALFWIVIFSGLNDSMIWQSKMPRLSRKRIGSPGLVEGRSNKALILALGLPFNEKIKP